MDSVFVLTTDLVVLTIVMLAFLWLRNQMRDYVRDKRIENPPYVRLIILFATCGSLLWYVAALVLPSTGVGIVASFFLLLIAPIAMLIIAAVSFSDKDKSPIHYGVYIASIAYLILFAAFMTLVMSQCRKPTGGPP